jgi:hypothetical protein
MKIAPTCFGLRPSSGSLHGAWLKLHYILLGYVVLWQHVLRLICVLCAVQNGAESVPFLVGYEIAGFVFGDKLISIYFYGTPSTKINYSSNNY